MATMTTSLAPIRMANRLLLATLALLLAVGHPGVSSSSTHASEKKRTLLRSSAAAVQEESKKIRQEYGGASYVGCFLDSPPSMEHDTKTELDLPGCLLYCTSQNYQFAGIRNMSDCFCSNGFHGPPSDPEECEEACGGGGCESAPRLLVFETSNAVTTARRANWLGDMLFGTAAPTPSPTIVQTVVGSMDGSMDGSQDGSMDGTTPIFKFSASPSTPDNPTAAPTMEYTMDNSEAEEKELDGINGNPMESPTESPTEPSVLGSIANVLNFKVRGEDRDVVDVDKKVASAGKGLGGLADVILPGNDSYIGCYKDKLHPRAMAFSSHSKHNVGTCRHYCRERNFIYAGLENGKKCFCSHQKACYEKYGEADNEDECNMPCELSGGSAEAICGGPDRLSVYRAYDETPLPAPAPTSSMSPTGEHDATGAIDGFQGCFANVAGAPTFNHTTVDPHNIQSCIQYCKDEDFGYAGLQAGSECLCGDAPSLNSAVDEMECDVLCSEGGGGFCGGGERLSVYAVPEGEEERERL